MMKISDIAFRNLDKLPSGERQLLERTRYAPETIVVPERAPAIEVARIADVIGSCQILVTDDAGVITGLLMPRSVRQRIERYRQRRFGSLRESLEDLLHDPSEANRGFHHEWLNDDRPDMTWCVKGGHMTDTDPCDVHP